MQNTTTQNDKIVLSFILSLSCFFCQSQTKHLSSYKGLNPSDAIIDFMYSKNDTLVIDYNDSPWILEPIKIQNVSNKTILFEDEVELCAKPNAFPSIHDALFKFFDCSKIQLLGKGNTIRMNKEEYVNGEFRHIFRLRGCTNITIKNLVLRESGGDAITIGKSKKNPYCKSVVIDHVQAINNKRQGISITSASGVYVYNSVFSETKGTAPGAGVDIEPNTSDDVIENIFFENCVFENNYHAGIAIGLSKAKSSSRPVNIEFQNCKISNNFLNNGVWNGAEIFIRAHKTDPVMGVVNFKNCEITKGENAFLFAKKNVKSFSLNFENCRVYENDTEFLHKTSPFVLLLVPSYKEHSDFGGIYFGDFNIETKLKSPFMKVLGSKWGLFDHLSQIQGDISIKNNFKPMIQYIDYSEERNNKVDINFIVNN